MRVSDFLESLPYDLKLQELCKYIELGKHRRVLLQLPEGLKPHSASISRALREACSAEVIVSGDPGWGACDIPLDEAKRVGATLIVHYGHYPYSYHPVMGGHGVDVVYIPMEYTMELPREVLQNLKLLLEERGLKKPVVVATAQHLREAKRVAEFLRSGGFEASLPLSYGNPPGLILGCDYRALASPSQPGGFDSVVVVAGGLFHALGAALSTDRPVFQLDPYRREVRELSEEKSRWLKVRYGQLMKAMQAANWGIWVGALSGQSRMDLALHIARLIEEKGGSYVFFYSRYVTLRELSSVDSSEIDAHVITSCPRVPIDDFSLVDYPKPVLTPGEAIMVITGKLEPYRFLW